MRTDSYWQLSRAPRYSLLFALPLLLLYETLALMLGGATGGVRNGADAILRALFAAVAGPWGTAVLAGVLIGGSVWLVARDRRRNRAPLRARVFWGMLAESVALASLLGTVVALLTVQLLRPVLAMSDGPIQSLGWGERLMLSLGAGLYEELLFRVVLVTLLAVGARTLLGLGARGAGVFAVLVGALLFSAAHHVGAYGEPLALVPFTFRFVAGVVFSALYLLRGFGITAWTHALYDVFVLVV
ncbi:MAG TPA: CPBP family intramembrane glutamic endopeptidase [Gemmatimonadales bacterium]